MNYKRFKHILINEISGISKELEASPADWKELEIRHYRHLDYHSVLREDTVSQRFVLNNPGDKGGYEFIKNAFDADGLKAVIRYEREELNGITNGYESDFVGYLDFNPESGFVIEDEWIEIKAIDNRKLARLIARDEIESNLFSLTSIDNISITPFYTAYDSINFLPIDIFLRLDSHGYFTGVDQKIYDGNSGSIENFPYYGTLDINEIGDRISISSTPSDTVIYTNNLDYDTYLTNIQISGNYLVYYQLDLPVSGSSRVELVLFFTIYNISDDSIYDSEGIYLELSTYIGILHSGFFDNDFDETLSSILIPSGHYVKFRAFIFAQDTVVGGNRTLSGNILGFDIDEFNFHEKTDGKPQNSIRGLFLHRAFERLIQLNTSETNINKLLYAEQLGWTSTQKPYDWRTYLTTGDYAKEFLFNGYLARQFNDRALNVSFKSLFKSYSAYNPSYMWYDKNNDYFVIGDIEGAYQLDAFINQLGQVRNIKGYPAKEFYFSTIQSGYPKTENEDFQGINEINTETEHSISIEVKNGINIRSDYRQASIDIELTRRTNIFDNASKDTKYDNYNYIVSTNGSTTTQGDIVIHESFLGAEQYYNLKKTPRMNLQRWSKILLAPLYKDSTEIIQFRKSAKDTNIKYTDPETSFLTYELDNIGQSRLQERLIDPYFYEFEAIYTPEIRAEIRANPHKYFIFEDKDRNIFYGYIWEIIGNPYTQKATYKLIKLNENRLS